MSGVAITKVEITPQTIYCNQQIKIAICAFEITNGSGSRRLPFRLDSKQDSVNTELKQEV